MTEENIKIDPEKLHLEREITEKEKLRIFLLLITNLQAVPMGIQQGMIMAYRDGEAVDKAKQDYPGKNIFYGGQSVTVESLIRQVYMESGKIEIESEGPLPMPSPAMTPEKLAKEQFRAGLLMCLKEFVGQEDQEPLKKIIEKI